MQLHQRISRESKRPYLLWRNVFLLQLLLNIVTVQAAFPNEHLVVEEKLALLREINISRPRYNSDSLSKHSQHIATDEILTNSPNPDERHTHTQRVPISAHKLLVGETRLWEKMALRKLVHGVSAPSTPLSSSTTQAELDPFEDLQIALPLPSQLVHDPGQNNRHGDKYFVGPLSIGRMGKRFVVYAAGNAMKVELEMNLAILGASVYSFDCTISDPPQQWAGLFSFFPWCIGKAAYMDTFYSKSSKLNQSEYKFFSLAEIKAQLGHTKIDLLKLDIEGFEWNLLETEILPALDGDLPTQLLFELHTEGAKKKYVPPELIRGRDRYAVNKVMLGLFHRGYRIVHMKRNAGDHKCMDFTLLRVWLGLSYKILQVSVYHFGDMLDLCCWQGDG